MKFNDLVGKQITHKKFGDGIVTFFSLNNEKTTDSIITIDFKRDTKRFPLKSLPKYFEDVPQELIDRINEIENYHNKEVIVKEEPKKKLLTAVNTNEKGKELKLKDWKNSLKYVVIHWWGTDNNPTPVVMDNKYLYINAKAACESLGVSKIGYGVIYSICNGCEGKQLFEGHRWRFAKEEEITDIIENLEENYE